MLPNFGIKANKLRLWLFEFRLDADAPGFGTIAMLSHPAPQDIGVNTICERDTRFGDDWRSAGFNQLAPKIVGVSTAFLDRRPFDV